MKNIVNLSYSTCERSSREQVAAAGDICWWEREGDGAVSGVPNAVARLLIEIYLVRSLVMSTVFHQNAPFLQAKIVNCDLSLVILEN